MNILANQMSTWTNDTPHARHVLAGALAAAGRQRRHAEDLAMGGEVIFMPSCSFFVDNH